MKPLFARRVFRTPTAKGTIYNYPQTLVAAPVEAFEVDYFEALGRIYRTLTARPEWWESNATTAPASFHLPCDGVCRHCGGSFFARDLKVHYCSDDCRSAFKAAQAIARYARRGSRYTPKTPAMTTCCHCGKSYTPKRSDSRYCSVKCRVAHHRHTPKV